MQDKTVIKGNVKYNGNVRKAAVIVNNSTGLIENIDFEYDKTVYDNEITYNDEYTIEAGDFNAHSHPEQSIYTDIVDKSWDLPTWCRNTIYKYSPLLKPEHIYYGCCRAFSRMLLFGVTSVMVSFYCHSNSGNEFDKQVIKAARDTGIRLYFGRMNYDIINENAYDGKKISQRTYYETFKEAEKNFIGLLKEASEKIEIAPSIHSIHASTRGAIINAINLASKYDKIVQFHLSEDSGDVELAQKLYGLRPVEFLAGLYEKGYIERLDHLMLSDCVWVDENELMLIKKYKMKVVLNPRMNDRIKTGEAKLYDFIKYGIVPFLGTDGEASNDDLSISGEKKFLISRFPHVSSEIIENLSSASLKYKNGYIGSIETGNFCDLKVIKNGGIYDVFVGGKKVVHSGKLLNIDIDKDIEEKLHNSVKELFI